MNSWNSFLDLEAEHYLTIDDRDFFVINHRFQELMTLPLSSDVLSSFEFVAHVEYDGHLTFWSTSDKKETSNHSVSKIIKTLLLHFH